LDDVGREVDEGHSATSGALDRSACMSRSDSTIGAMGPRDGSLRRGSTWSLAGVLVLGALATAAVATGDTVTVLDGSTNSRANKFDISETTAGHKGSLLSHEIRTYSPWRSRELTATQSSPRLIALYIWRP